MATDSADMGGMGDLVNRERAVPLLLNDVQP
jgi:hypothetical protein